MAKLEHASLVTDLLDQKVQIDILFDREERTRDIEHILLLSPKNGDYIGTLDFIMEYEGTLQDHINHLVDEEMVKIYEDIEVGLFDFCD